MEDTEKSDVIINRETHIKIVDPQFKKLKEDMGIDDNNEAKAPKKIYPKTRINQF